jgi:hypothetical protein
MSFDKKNTIEVPYDNSLVFSPNEEVTFAVWVYPIGG